MAKFHIFRSFIFPPTPVFPTIFPPERENKSQTGRKKHAHFFFFAAWRKKNRMHVRHFFRQFSSFGPISWPIAGKLVFSLRCNKQYVRLGQCCWFFSLFFWHSESGFALPSCQKNRENKTANIALGAQLLDSGPPFLPIVNRCLYFCSLRHQSHISSRREQKP